MKPGCLAILLILCFRETAAQKFFLKEIDKVLHHIETKFTIPDSNKIKTGNDFFLYDISIDKTGKLTKADLIIYDSLSCYNEARRIGDEIVTKFSFTKPKYRKLFLPVLIVYPESDEDETTNNGEQHRTINFFAALSKLRFPDVYVSGLITIMTIHSEK